MISSPLPRVILLILSSLSTFTLTTSHRSFLEYDDTGVSAYIETVTHHNELYLNILLYRLNNLQQAEHRTYICTLQYVVFWYALFWNLFYSLSHNQSPSLPFPENSFHQRSKVTSILRMEWGMGRRLRNAPRITTCIFILQYILCLIAPLVSLSNEGLLWFASLLRGPWEAGSPSHLVTARRNKAWVIKDVVQFGLVFIVNYYLQHMSDDHNHSS